MNRVFARIHTGTPSTYTMVEPEVPVPTTRTSSLIAAPVPAGGFCIWYRYGQMQINARVHARVRVCAGGLYRMCMRMHARVRLRA